MKSALPILFAIAIAGAAARPADAQVIPLTHKDLCTQAEHVVRGRVAGMQARYEGPVIVTDVTVEVAESLKGSVPGRIEIQVPGGTIGGVTLRVSEAPSFRLHEDVVIFTVVRDGRHRVFGQFRGKYTVVGDSIRELKETTLEDLRTELKAIIHGK